MDWSLVSNCQCKARRESRKWCFHLSPSSADRLLLTSDHRTPYDEWKENQPMDMIPLKPERKAQLEEYAKRRGQDPAAALDDALAIYLEWERQDFVEAVEGIRRGYEDVKSGRTRPATKFSPT